MKPVLPYNEPALLDLVDQPVARMDAPGPGSGKGTSKRFRFTNHREGMPLDLAEEYVNAAEDGLILLMPVAVLLPGAIRDR